jgi:4-amino-4-deoxy-L-arabinose transferase-like glycosyltransferase
MAELSARVDPALGADLRRLARRAARAPGRHRVALAALGAGLATFAVYVLALPHNPPCCFPDEPSTAYNAWLIATTGRDEHGAHLPLYFQAFGEFRSPLQIYLMAGIFKVFGPSLLLGRYLTRTAMFLTIAAVVWLAWAMTGRRSVAALVALLGLTTPQLYEISRLGTEGPLVDLPFAAFALLLLLANRRPRWGPGTGIALAVPLALAAYTYPIARPLVPALALGTLVFASRRRVAGLLAGAVALALLLAPILVFMRDHPGALSGYPGELTWYRSSMSIPTVAWTFVEHYAGVLDPVRVLWTGDPNPRHHVDAFGAVLLPMWLLALAGAAMAVLRRPRDRFGLYALGALLLALVPASLTHDVFHTPRLIAAPLFALMLCVAPLRWLVERRRGLLLAAVVAVTAGQAAWFAHVYVRDGADEARVATFQADLDPAFDAAARSGARPIWVLDIAYIGGYWKAVLDGVPHADVKFWARPADLDPFARGRTPDVTAFEPPSGVAAVGAAPPCAGCRVLYRGPNFNAWVQK